jgi:basic membrane protein A
MVRNRLFLVLAGSLLALLHVGCTPTTSQQGTQEEPQGAKAGKKSLKVGVVFDSGGRGDKSFNDSAWAGIERAKAELGIEERSVESKSDKDYETNISTLAEQGMDLVVAVGMNQQTAVSRVAPKFPDVKFAIVDGSVEAPNVRELKFAEHEGSFLAGYLAALVSKAGKIGFVGGEEIPLIKKFEAGYIAGAKTAKPSIEVLPAKYTGSWNNLDLGKAAANVLFAGGADIVYHAAGRCGLGVINAAKEAGKYAIGVDSDQDSVAPGSVLTSMVKRVDEAVLQTIRDVQQDAFSNGAKNYTLKDGGVGLSPMTHTKDKIGAEVLQKVEEIKAKIVAGEVTVPDSAAALAEYMASLKSPG